MPSTTAQRRLSEMNIETLRDFCRALPAVTEDVKWGHDLCFSVAGKMFCVASLDGPLTFSFTVRDEEFDKLSNSPGLRPRLTSHATSGCLSKKSTGSVARNGSTTHLSTGTQQFIEVSYI